MQTNPSCTKTSRANASVHSEVTAITVINEQLHTTHKICFFLYDPASLSHRQLSMQGCLPSQTTPSCTKPSRHNTSASSELTALAVFNEQAQERKTPSSMFQQAPKPLEL